MARLQADDPNAFVHLYERHGGAVYRSARRICASPADAEEATQDAFVALWRARHNYRPERGTVRGWLLGIVHNRAVDICRRVTPAVGGNAPEELGRGRFSEGADSVALRREDARRLHLHLAQLPEAQARAVVLAYFGDLSNTQIAAVTSAPLGTVKSRLRLGLDNLRRQVAA
jgi:RNA polymerase sigma-70 factor (ECF subfamily)